MQKKTLLVTGAAVSALLSANLIALPADAQSYKNKTVTIVVGFGAGGGADTFGRLLGRHLGANIPDRPTVIVQNSPGAGGFKAVNHVYTVAPKDGTYIILTASAHATAPSMGNKAARWDMFKLQWLGNLTREPASCVASGSSGIKSVMEGKTRQIIFGASGKSATSAIQPRLLANLLGLNLKVIAGYKGTASQRLAMEKGELDATCSFWASLALGPQRQEMESGKLVPIVQFGSKPHPAFRGAPLVYDLAKTEDDRKVMRFIYGPSEISRPFAVAPGVPAAQVAMLRGSFWKTVNSDALKADAEKLRLIVDPMDWKETEAALRESLDVSKKIIDRAKWASSFTAKK
ncbi:MAG: tripartite tricarboxylate transporter substrate-binding protein [Proteobacteria bacterium]|nr:tripartite tricarboxylate transporter substrate-binding protein [Pseudomonadota bacterium]